MDILYSVLPRVDKVVLDDLQLGVDSRNRSTVFYKKTPFAVIADIEFNVQNNIQIKGNELTILKHHVEQLFGFTITDKLDFPIGGVQLLDKNFNVIDSLSSHFLNFIAMQKDCKIILSLTHDICDYWGSNRWSWQITSVYAPHYVGKVSKMQEEITYIYNSLKTSQEGTL